MSANEISPSGFSGQPLLRTEDSRLLRGGGRYVDDIDLPHQLHAVYVRSPHAHAQIVRVDTTDAEQLAGVVAVVIGSDIVNDVGRAPMAWHPPGTEVLVPESRPLMDGRVACVGAPVAVVLAEHRYIAEDAAEKVNVEYEQLPVVVDPLDALEVGAPLVHPEFGTNICFETEMSGGDVVAAFEEASLVVERTITNHKIAAVPIEPRGVLAEPDGDRVRLWTSTQNPHLVRRYVSRQLSWDEGRIRVITPDVGGGFGCKANVYGEETLAVWCAASFRRPIKWIESRDENLTSTNHGRAQTNRVRVAVSTEGRITALEMHVIADLGAYHLLFTPFIPATTAVVALGCYAIPAMSVKTTGVFTNTFPTDAIRGAGRPEAAHMIELVVDQVAVELGLDPVEVRRRNFISKEDFPAVMPHGPVYDSGNYHGSLDVLLEHVGLERFQSEQKELLGRGIYRGIGFSTYMEACGLGPSKIAGPSGNGLEMSFWESAVVTVAADGSVTLQTGSCPAGQGHETAFAQIVADRVGADPSRVTVISGDTDAVPNGMGTYGSRSISVGGEAAAQAADRVVEKARRIVAELLEASAEDIVLEGGRFCVVGSPDRSLSLSEVARAAYVTDRLPEGFEAGLEASSFFTPPGFVHPFGAHAAIVDVDIETGEIKIVRYIAVDDCGTVINPMIVDGQIHGGIAQAVGQALLEKIEYSPEGQPLTSSLLDYSIPTAAELPHFELDRTVTPSPNNSLGAKGAGEAGTIAATPALTNAVLNALRPLGVEFVNMPLSPEAIRNLVRAND